MPFIYIIYLFVFKYFIEFIYLYFVCCIDYNIFIYDMTQTLSYLIQLLSDYLPSFITPKLSLEVYSNTIIFSKIISCCQYQRLLSFTDFSKSMYQANTIHISQLSHVHIGWLFRKYALLTAQHFAPINARRQCVGLKSSRKSLLLLPTTFQTKRRPTLVS